MGDTGTIGHLLTKADEVLRAATTVALLRASHALTHKMHDTPDRNLRAQRDLIDAEIIRRTEQASA